MSFTGRGDFVSLGYPWVLPEYQGELQEELYRAVYGFAASREYGGRTFAQRFREQWTAQISFFLRHGFEVQRSEPIYALDLRSARTDQILNTPTRREPESPRRPVDTGRYRLETQGGFQWEEFQKLAATRLPQEQLAMFQLYFESVEFDFAVKALEGDRSVAYLGFAIRLDTGLGELIAVAFGDASTDVVGPCLLVAIRELRARKALFLAIKPFPVESATEIIEGFGFKKVTTEVLLSKSI
jgi:hypothetical protein